MAWRGLGRLFDAPNDKKLLKKANALLKDIERGGYDGIGKPEPLKGNLSGYYSRRIDDYNRIVYKIENNIIEIVQCGTHYHDWKKILHNP